MEGPINNCSMDTFRKPEKWARWPSSKIELFLKIVIVFWIQKLKRDILSFILKEELPLVHLEHKHVKKSAALLGIPATDSKSLQIKYVRIVESFPKKPELPRKLLEAVRLCEEFPHLNFLLGSCFASPTYVPLFERFDKIITECTQMVLARRREGKGQEGSPETVATLSAGDRPALPLAPQPTPTPEISTKRISKKKSNNQDEPMAGFRKSLRLAKRRCGNEPCNDSTVNPAFQLAPSPAMGREPPFSDASLNPSAVSKDPPALANPETLPAGVNPGWRQLFFKKLASLRTSQGHLD